MQSTQRCVASHSPHANVLRYTLRRWSDRVDRPQPAASFIDRAGVEDVLNKNGIEI
jgi:hypothetical protein